MITGWPGGGGTGRLWVINRGVVCHLEGRAFLKQKNFCASTVNEKSARTMAKKWA